MAKRHIVDEYLGVAFWNGPDPIPISKLFTIVMLLMYPLHPAYDRIAPGAEFTIRERREDYWSWQSPLKDHQRQTPNA